MALLVIRYLNNGAGQWLENGEHYCCCYCCNCYQHLISIYIHAGTFNEK